MIQLNRIPHHHCRTMDFRLYLASTQVPKLCGLHGEHVDFGENCTHILKSLNQTNVTSLIVGGTALAVLLAGKVFLPNKLVALLVVVGGIVISAWTLECSSRL